MINNGKTYETFVQNLYQALLDSEKPLAPANIELAHKNIKIEKNIKLVDNNRITREFDLYWAYELGGITYHTIVECKDYNTKISIEKIDALVGKITSFRNLTPIFATRLGY